MYDTDIRFSMEMIDILNLIRSREWLIDRLN